MRISREAQVTIVLYFRKTEYKLNVEEYIKAKDPGDDAADGPDVDELEEDVRFHQQQAQKLLDEIPEFAVVSMFKIDCRDFRDHLSGKHKKIAELEIEIIAKRAKQSTDVLLEKFKEIHDKVNRKPDHIEGLTAIKEFMQK